MRKNQVTETHLNDLGETTFYSLALVWVRDVRAPIACHTYALEEHFPPGHHFT